MAIKLSIWRRLCQIIKINIPSLFVQTFAHNYPNADGMHLQTSAAAAANGCALRCDKAIHASGEDIMRMAGKTFAPAVPDVGH